MGQILTLFPVPMTSALNLKVDTTIPALSGTLSGVLSKLQVTGLKSWLHAPKAGSLIHTESPSTLLYPNLGKVSQFSEALSSQQTFLEQEMVFRNSGVLEKLSVK